MWWKENLPSKSEPESVKENLCAIPGLVARCSDLPFLRRGEHSQGLCILSTPAITLFPLPELPGSSHPQTSKQWPWSHFQGDPGGPPFHIHLHHRLPAPPQPQCSQVRSTVRFSFDIPHLELVCLGSCDPTAFVSTAQGTGPASTVSSGRLWSWGGSGCVCW